MRSSHPTDPSPGRDAPGPLARLRRRVADAVRGSRRRHGLHLAIALPFTLLIVALGAVPMVVGAGTGTHRVVPSLLVTTAAVALTWWLSAAIARPTTTLSSALSRIRWRHPGKPIAVRSRVAEVDRLARDVATMTSALQRLVALADAAGRAPDLDALAALALEHVAPVHGATSAALLLRSEDGRRLVRVGERCTTDPLTDRTAASDYASDAVELPTPARERRLRPDQHAALHGETVRIEDTTRRGALDTSDYRSRAVLVVPLRARGGAVIGVLHLGDPGHDGAGRDGAADGPDTRAIVEALAAHVALAFENQRLEDVGRAGIESLIHLLARSIETKSPHTGRHCERVPILSALLAEAASESTLPAFRDFTLTEAGRDELAVASWLHDCGKVTTPDHVVDKGTKLETVHNRIHEIRTRFEVLWRDAEIECLRTLLHDGEADPALARRRRDDKQAGLVDDFAFLARCNVGTESMDAGDVRRVRELARRTWVRHFDDTLGLSASELGRRGSSPNTPLPVGEPLLADKPFHRIARASGAHPRGDNPLGFDMDVPSLASDDGEIHNLTIARGTLNAEERFRVNDHVVRTIEMLDAIPFPPELARVPRIAGSHHERLDGSGYPRRRTAGELGIEERILAIADVFEALTADDRPYRSARTMEGSIAIMRGLCDGGELCSDLFELFVERRLHLAYAERLRHPTPSDALGRRFLGRPAPGEVPGGTD